MFDIFFSLKRITHVAVVLKLDKSIYFESLGMALDDTSPMFMHATNKIVGHTNIDCTAWATGKEINVILSHRQCVPKRDGRDKPGHDNLRDRSKFNNMYLTLKALHIIAVIAWMAGMLYLPRLFVYHAAAKPGSEQSETFKVMERRLLKAIINPAMIAAWLLGAWLAWSGGWLAAPWLYAKLALVLVLSGLHGYLARLVKQFAADQNPHSQRYYRIINEIPTVLMILIVLLAVVKPF